MNWTLIYLAIGLVAGLFSGLLGIGGGTIVVPALVFICGLGIHKAQGTILAAFLPPVAFLAFWRYFKAGQVDLGAAAWIALGIFVGGYFGAGLSLSLPADTVRKVFAVFLIFVAVKLISGK